MQARPSGAVDLMALRIIGVVCAVSSAGCHAGRYAEVEYDPSRLPERDVTIRPGRYRIAFVAETGDCKGSTAIGTLTLRRAQASDRSPQTREGPTQSSKRFTLWGFTDVDMHEVCAPVESTQSGAFPDPRSDDPIYRKYSESPV